MSHEGYKGGATAGGYWGIAAAAVVATPIFLFQLLVNTLGCEGAGPDCGMDGVVVLAPPAIAGLAAFWIVRTVVNRILRKLAGD